MRNSLPLWWEKTRKQGLPVESCVGWKWLGLGLSHWLGTAWGRCDIDMPATVAHSKVWQWEIIHQLSPRSNLPGSYEDPILKLSKCLSIGQWLKKIWHILMIKYYSGIKWDKLYATIWNLSAEWMKPDKENTYAVLLI